MLTFCASFEQKPSPLPSECPAWRIPPYCPGNRREPAPRQYSPGTTNLRSSAFICGSFFAEAPYSKDFDRINRMDRINPSTKSLSKKSINSIFTNKPQRTQRARRFLKRVSVFSVLSVALTSRISSNPVNPVHPVHPSFSAAPDINRCEFIKTQTSQNPILQNHTTILPSCAGSEPVLRWYRKSFSTELVRHSLCPNMACSFVRTMK